METEDVQQGRSGEHAALLKWALESQETALALIRDGRVSSSNARFAELGSGGPLRWRTGPHACVRYASLRELACTEALATVKPGAVARFDQPASARTLELRFEQSADGVVLMVHDVTARLRAEAEHMRDREALLQEERLHAMGVLASGVAHDLNHALNVIGLRIATLKADPVFSRARRTLDGLSRVVGNAAGIVSRLQELARRRRDRPNEALDLTAVLTGSVEMARSELDGLPIHIEARVPPLPLVRGTAAEVSHLLTELLMRARDAMVDGGTIRITGGVEPGRVVVDIRDDGGNIPEAELGRIFDPFQGPFGLSIAYGVMARLGGNLSVKNIPEGGVAFTLTFPTAQPVKLAAALPAPGRQKLHVLLVDDEADNLEVLSELLALEGQSVETAQGGRDALERVRNGARFDVVLCDVAMPEMSGWQVAREIHALSPETRVYMLTGWANEISADDPRREGICGVLAKPLDIDALHRELGGACDAASGQGLSLA